MTIALTDAWREVKGKSSFNNAANEVVATFAEQLSGLRSIHAKMKRDKPLRAELGSIKKIADELDKNCDKAINKVITFGEWGNSDEEEVQVSSTGWSSK